VSWRFVAGAFLLRLPGGRRRLRPAGVPAAAGSASHSGGGRRLPGHLAVAEILHQTDRDRAALAALHHHQQRHMHRCLLVAAPAASGLRLHPRIDQLARVQQAAGREIPLSKHVLQRIAGAIAPHPKRMRSGHEECLLQVAPAKAHRHFPSL
jgi:hypothetical protein